MTDEKKAIIIIETLEEKGININYNFEKVYIDAILTAFSKIRITEKKPI